MNDTPPPPIPEQWRLFGAYEGALTDELSRWKALGAVSAILDWQARVLTGRSEAAFVEVLADNQRFLGNVERDWSRWLACAAVLRDVCVQVKGTPWFTAQVAVAVARARWLMALGSGETAGDMGPLNGAHADSMDPRLRRDMWRVVPADYSATQLLGALICAPETVMRASGPWTAALQAGLDTVVRRCGELLSTVGDRGTWNAPHLRADYDGQWGASRSFVVTCAIYLQGLERWLSLPRMLPRWSDENIAELVARPLLARLEETWPTEDTERLPGVADSLPWVGRRAQRAWLERARRLRGDWARQERVRVVRDYRRGCVTRADRNYMLQRNDLERYTDEDALAQLRPSLSADIDCWSRGLGPGVAPVAESRGPSAPGWMRAVLGVWARGCEAHDAGAEALLRGTWLRPADAAADPERLTQSALPYLVRGPHPGAWLCWRGRRWAPQDPWALLGVWWTLLAGPASQSDGFPGCIPWTERMGGRWDTWSPVWDAGEDQ